MIRKINHNFPTNTTSSPWVICSYQPSTSMNHKAVHAVHVIPVASAKKPIGAHGKQAKTEGAETIGMDLPFPSVFRHGRH